MDVLKRSEFCGGSKAKEEVRDTIRVIDIKSGTIFTGIVGAYANSSTWMRTSVGAVRLSSDGSMGAGWHTGYNATVKNYEVLNATLVWEPN